MAKYKEIPREQLEELYIVQNLSLEKVAQILNVSTSIVHRAVKYQGLRKKAWAEWRQLDSEQLKELLVVQGLGASEVAAQMKVSVGTIQAAVKQYGLQKSKEAITALKRKTNKERYGVEVPLRSEVFRQKAVETCFAKYGCENALQNPEVIAKVKATKLRKYKRPGHPTSAAALAKRAKTTRQRYGVANYAQRHRTEASIAITADKASLEKFLIDFKGKFSRKPVTAEIAELLELSPTSLQALLQKWDLYKHIELYRSKYEVELAQLFPTEYINTRAVVSGEELDLYYPDYKLAVEFHGLYWHSYPWKPMNYHRDKYIACRKAGIRLIQIFEDEWLYSRNIVTNTLNYLLHRLPSREVVGARKCTVSEVTAATASRFMRDNHIQGFCRGIYLALIYDSQPVAIMILNKPQLSRQGREQRSGLEISRFAVSGVKSVPGAFAKLLSHASTLSAKLFTYADLRWVSPDDNIYLANGFKQYGEIKPAYWYWTNQTKYDGYLHHQRYYRFLFTKKKIRNQFSEYLPSESDGWTEERMMTELNWFRVYDAGKISYEFIK